MPEDSIPKTVERYVEEHEDQGMDTSKAWAIAWSRYCSKHEDSPHCNKDQYFEGKPEIAEGIKSSKTALRGDYSSGRGELMLRWDQFQKAKGFEDTLDELLDWMGGEMAVKYFRHVTRSHSRDYDMSSQDTQAIAREIIHKSRLGYNQLGDALVKAMSVDEFEDFLEDIGYPLEEGEEPSMPFPHREAPIEFLENREDFSLKAAPDQLARLSSMNPDKGDFFMEACKRQIVKNAMAEAPVEDLRAIEDMMKGKEEVVWKGPDSDPSADRIYDRVTDMMHDWKNGHFAEQVGPWYYTIEGVKQNGKYVGTFRAMNTSDPEQDDKVGIVHMRA